MRVCVCERERTEGESKHLGKFALGIKLSELFVLHFGSLFNKVAARASAYFNYKLLLIYIVVIMYT